ncbi:hypothetical protein [Pseudonocardia humida]|uniref:MalT-like winged helix domain-containing protein n=1 Tax=Pseudonocardia humida TaxID=2800819 RepID=A0ABT1ACG1_9PSEU|nr:hypothetical protein [Pseudonocardia humida]MCO1660605.1 hypothetical protein [Pseudonocardia humida]
MIGEEKDLRPGSPTVPAAKLVVPRTSQGHLHRPRLVRRLAGAGPGSVLLVCAPAGYGKTLLLADWVSTDPTPTAWLSLDEDDNDDRLFWAAVVAAVLACPTTPPDSPLHDLALPAVPSRDPDFLPALLGALHDLPEPVRLVLDDVHELTSAEPLHGLTRLVRDRPPAVQIVLATRSDPPVHLHRLRLTGALREIRAAALAFSFDEASALLAMIDDEVRDDQVRLILEHTEGWVAGLRLAALSLRESDDRDTFLTDLVGNGRAISDYLVGEILSRLTDEVRDVLTAVSVCDHLTAPLAVALSGQDDAGELLLAMERETSLVVSYGEGRRWFRVHRLLLSHLRADVRRQRPDLLSVLHARAARWFADAHDPPTALRHARAAEDPDLIDELVHRHGLALAALGHHDAVIEALDAAAAWRAPGAVAELVRALACIERGDAAAVARHVARAEAVWPADPAPRLLSLRELVEARRTWTAGRWGAADPGRSRPFADGSVGEQIGLVVRANAALARGDPRAAEETARTATDRAISDGNSYTTARGLTTLSIAAGMGGDITRMVDLAERAERSAPAERWRSTEGAALNAVCAPTAPSCRPARRRACASPKDSSTSTPARPGAPGCRARTGSCRSSRCCSRPPGSTSAAVPGSSTRCGRPGRPCSPGWRCRGRPPSARCSSTARRSGCAAPIAPGRSSAGRRSAWAPPVTWSSSARWGRLPRTATTRPGSTCGPSSTGPSPR